MKKDGKVSVLLVDDSLVSLKFTERMLRETVFDVSAVAMTGHDAIEEYRVSAPDVVLLDIVLPDIYGDEVLENIKAIDPQAKVVMLSSLGSEKMVETCLSLGALGFVVKPIDRSTLLDTLTDLFDVSLGSVSTE